jgi:hypothetical protein
MSELDARLDAAKRFVSATRGAAHAERVTTENLAQVERAIAAELPTLRIKAPAGSPPVAASTSQPAAPPADGRVSEEQYAAMDAAERIAYARQFPQSNEGGPRR